VTPANRVGVGFYGGGSVLWAYLQLLDRLVAQGIAWEGPVWVRRRDAWPALLDRRPDLRLVEDAEDVIAAGVDVVVVITAPDSHAELAGRALECGAHVLVEKPLASTRREAEPLYAMAERHGLLLMSAPFVHLSPTFRKFWTGVADGQIGDVHSARALYGNAGSSWAAWYHDAGIGPLGDLAPYNLKSLTALLGPVVDVVATEGRAFDVRTVAGIEVAEPDADVVHLVLRHDNGTISVVTASHAIANYRRPAIELYGTEGTADLLGDDWAPTGIEIWTNDRGSWEVLDAIEPTWLWTDGLRELVAAVAYGAPPLHDPAHDLHVLDIIEAARRSAATGARISVESRFRPLDLRLDAGPVHVVHDRTRGAEFQV
jgi:predicted dehydrogenase